MTCCKRPSIANMDHERYDWDTKAMTPRVNRCCLNCHAHWTGTPDNIRQFTSKEWDRHLMEELRT